MSVFVGDLTPEQKEALKEVIRPMTEDQRKKSTKPRYFYNPKTGRTHTVLPGQDASRYLSDPSYSEISRAQLREYRPKGRLESIQKKYAAGEMSASDVAAAAEEILRLQGVEEQRMILSAPEGQYYRGQDVKEYNRAVVEHNKQVRKQRIDLVKSLLGETPQPDTFTTTYTITYTDPSGEEQTRAFASEEEANNWIEGYEATTMGPPAPTEEARLDALHRREGGLPTIGLPGPAAGPSMGSYGARITETLQEFSSSLSSSQMWEESRQHTEDEVGRLLGVLPYSPKGLLQIQSILTGSLESVLTPVLGILPGEQPFEVMPGEETVNWRNLEQKADEITRLGAMQVAQLSGLTLEVATTYLATVAGGIAAGKVVGAVGGLVSSIPVLGTRATSAANYLLRPRLVTTVAVGGGVVASEALKVAELASSGVDPWKIGMEIGLDVAKMRAFDVGFAKGLKADTFLKTAGETLPVKYGKVSVPTEGGGTVEWSGVYLSKGDEALPLTGKITFKNAADDVIASGYVPESNISSKVTIEAMKRMGYDPTDVQNIEDIRAIIAKTQGVTSKYIDDILPTETGTLSEKGVKAFKEYLKTNIKAVEQVYGSYAIKPQLKTDVEYVYTLGDKTVSALRLPGDIDIQLLTGGDEAARFADDLVAKLKEAGETVRMSAENPTLIEALVGEGKWAHAVDIHAAEDMIDSIPTVKAWGFNMDKASKVLEGLPIMGAGEQGIRKGVSIMGFQETGVGPAAHRVKDIPDFFQVQDTLISSMRIPSPGTRTRLEALLSRYGGMERVMKLSEGAATDITDTVMRVSYRPPSPTTYSAASPAAYVLASMGVSTLPKALTPGPVASPSTQVLRSASLPVSKLVSLPTYTPPSPYKPPSKPSPAPPPSKPKASPGYTPPPYKPPSGVPSPPKKPPKEPPSIPRYTYKPSPPSTPTLRKPPSPPPYIPSYMPPSRPPYTPPNISQRILKKPRTEKKPKKKAGVYELRVEFKTPTFKLPVGKAASLFKPVKVPGIEEAKKKKRRRKP